MSGGWLTGTETLVVSVLALAGFVRGAFGFGDALVAMPLLVLLLPTPSASALMALTALLIALLILFREWNQVDVRGAALLILTGMLGVPVGIWLAQHIDERVVKGLLGTLLVVFSAWSLRTRNPFSLTTERWAPMFGLVAGILGGAYNTAGPPLVIYATLRRWSPLQLRAFMQVYCLFGSGWLIVMHSVAGNITRQTFTLLGTAVPLIIVTTVVGQRLTATLAKQQFVRWIFGFLMLMGLGLLASCFSMNGQ